MADSRSIKVLVVDDERTIRELLSDTLAAVGYACLTAEDFRQAVDILDRENIDVVITDILLPGRSGVELLKHVKKTKPQIPVLAISGKNISGDEILAAGADGFLAKPFRIGKIEDLIESTLAKYDSSKARHRPTPKKIVVVDDEESIRRTLIDSLAALGYQALGVADGSQALKAIENESFDLMISDIRMPELNGIELLNAVRQKFPNLPVVIITAYPLAYPEERAMLEGAAGYISKPFRINQIDKLLSRIFYNFEAPD